MQNAALLCIAEQDAVNGAGSDKKRIRRRG